MITDCLGISFNTSLGVRLFEIESDRKTLRLVSENYLSPTEVRYCETIYEKKKKKNIMRLRYQCDVLTLVNEV